MAWNDTTREHYMRKGLRYPSDLTDIEYKFLAVYLPERCATGRPRQVDLREVLNGIFYCVRSGCQWRLLPKDFPAWQSVYRYYQRWHRDGTWRTMHDAIYRLVRERKGKKARPTAAIIDSQSVKSSEAGGLSGYDAFKKTKGRKRHIMVDTLGFLIACHVHGADVQDRDGGADVLRTAKKKFRSLRHVWADCGYQGPRFAQSFTDVGKWTLSIVKRSDARFAAAPHRWIVERTFAWLGRHRRLTRDFEKNLAHSQAYCLIAMTGIMLRQLAGV